MQTPITINFDFTPKGRDDGLYTDPSIVHIPKIYQRAPYEQYIRVKNQNTGEYRNFTEFTNAKMQARVQTGGAILFALEEDTSNFVLDASGIMIKIPEIKTRNIQIAQAPNGGIPEQKFIYDIFLMKDGAIVEKFCQGSGFIVAAVTV